MPRQNLFSYSYLGILFATAKNAVNSRTGNMIKFSKIFVALVVIQKNRLHFPVKETFFNSKTTNVFLKLKPQKQPSKGVLQKLFCKHAANYGRKPMPKSDFNNFIEIALRHGRSPVNLLYIFRTSFHKNTSGGLLLKPVQ